MKFWLFCDIAAILLLTVIATVYLPQVPQKHGSLYDGIRLLISSEKLNAEMIWNETQQQIDENSAVLHTALDYMHNYETIINGKLDKLNNLEQSDELKKCNKQYERQIARFNRDLIYKYMACKQALNSSVSQLENEIVTEIKYIQNAAIEIQELFYDCNVTHLRRVSYNMHQSGITLCVLTKLGEINQHMLEAAQICLDIIARMSVSDVNEDGGNDDDDNEERPALNTNTICLDFQYLREEFEAIYENIMLCVNEGN